MKKNYVLSLLLLASASVVSSQNLQQERVLQKNKGLVSISRTEKAAIPIPTNYLSTQRTSHLEEGFEGAFPPLGWVVVDQDGDGRNWRQYTPAPNTGNFSAGSASWDASAGALNPNNYIITPQVHVTTAGDLTFYVAAQDPDWSSENYSVMLSTTGNAVSDFTVTLHTQTLPAGSSAWSQITLPMGAYVGDSVFIAFRHHNSSDWFNLKIDDVLCTVCDIVYPDDTLYLTDVNYAKVWENSDLECSIYPLEQAMANPLTFEAAVINGGNNDRTNVELVSSVSAAGVASPVYTNTTSLGTLLSLQFDTIRTNATFTPTDTGTYQVSMHLTSDLITTPIKQKSFQVSDSVYARDRGVVDGSTELGVACGGLEVSNLFDVFADQEAVSISAFISNASAGGPLAEIKARIYVYNTGTQAYDLLESTDFVGISASDKNKWKTIPLIENAQLTAGNFYRVSVEGFEHATQTVYVGTSGTSVDSTSHILDNNDCYGNGAGTMYYTNNTPMIRLNVMPAPNSVKEISKTINVDVYPNPNNGEFQLQMNNEVKGTYVISVSNMLGQQVYSERVTSTGSLIKTIDLSNFDKGIYLLSVANEGSKAKTVKKIVTY
ncbi:MAG: choice-of-anchor J domain-containing protein [Bacteroidota bacterium]|nr:choice-of-anchor J domain-containing protein [Bacteroidota bacterium]